MSEDLIKILQNYNFYKVRVIEIEDEMLSSNKTDINSWIRSENKHNCITEDMAIRLAQNPERAKYKKYIEAIDKIALLYIKGSSEKDEIKIHILNKYTREFIGVNALITKLQLLGFNIDRRDFYRYRENICDDLKKFI